MHKQSTKTLYNYWNQLRGSRSAPDRRDIDPTKIRSALTNTFILELNDRGEYDFRLAGSHICAAYGRELKGRSFTHLWHPRDRDAMGTLVRAVTEDHAVALVTYQAMTASENKVSVEAMLLPVRHNGSTATRILGAVSTIDEPYWFGSQPVVEQRIVGLRLIWPDDVCQPDDVATHEVPSDNSAAPRPAASPRAAAMVQPMAGRLHGRQTRRYAHLAVIDGGRV